MAINRLSSLTNMAAAYLSLDTPMYTDAEASLESAIPILREYAKQNDRAAQRYLAVALGDLSLLYYETSRGELARGASLESVEVAKGLYAIDPQAHRG